MTTHHMAPYIRLVRDVLDWHITDDQLQQMDEMNAKKIHALDAQLKDAQDNLGDTEVREILLAKCNHYARIGDLEMCLKVNA